jgi:asparagine synthase (glutamine-hydrolysing)
MCGICGRYNFGDGQPASLPELHRMTAVMAHRGPDDEGYFVRGALGFGFRRLSIIDLEGGHQPMSDAEERVWVVFNGEIYNFLELRTELESHGHRFRSRSDTEVLIHGYKQWGIDFLSRLNGMFGLALWDDAERRLILARDRLGVKPLYYRLDPGRVVFGSEMRPVMATGTGVPEVDPDAINMFLRYRYTPAPLTARKTIDKLAAGTRLVVENGRARVERWWRFSPTPFERMPSVAEAEEQLLELYGRAVKRQLISDVPVGLLLSGGVDSGLLLALMTRSNASWKTYTVGFGDGFSGDELRRAAETARYFHADCIPVQLSKGDFETALTKVVQVVEEPIASDSIVPMYFLCQRARCDVKVALMGQGPDELFGGYRRHLFARYCQYAKLLPAPLRPLAGVVLGSVFDRTMVTRFLSSLRTGDRMYRYQSVFSLLPGEVIDGLFRDGTLAAPGKDQLSEYWRDMAELMGNTDSLGGLQFLELRSSLPDELLMYADKLSMASGLEIRVPYLDHDIVEYVERLAASFKIRGRSQKWLHRRVGRRLLPPAVLDRPKLGFETPSPEWFRDPAGTIMSRYIEDPDSRMYGFLRYDAVNSMLRQHREQQANYADTLFSLSALELWLRASSD